MKRTRIRLCALVLLSILCFSFLSCAKAPSENGPETLSPDTPDAVTELSQEQDAPSIPAE